MPALWGQPEHVLLPAAPGHRELVHNLVPKPSTVGISYPSAQEDGHELESSVVTYSVPFEAIARLCLTPQKMGW